MNQKIHLDQEGLEKFYEQFGSTNLQLQSEMAKDRGEKSLDLYYKAIDFLYKTIAAVGIIAGFGFTGLDHVESRPLFILGETLLFSAIAFGIWRIQKIYLDERKSLEDFWSRVRQHFTERNALFEPILNKAMQNQLTREDIQELLDKDKQLYGILVDAPKADEPREGTLPRAVWIVFGLFASGSFLLLGSFVFCAL